MKKTNLLILTALLFCICTNLPAATIHVPAEYPTIQEAIDNSSSGDTIVVSPGTYYENINYKGLDITITSENPDDMAIVYTTLINGGLSGNTVTFATSEGNTSILRGLTVENGAIGIYCSGASPKIEKCVIRNSKSGHGISGLSSSAIISDCIIRKNNGDGIYNCNGHIKDCVIEENTGNGISNCDGVILRCEITANGADGILRSNGEINHCSVTANASNGINECDGQIKNSTVQGNLASGIYFADGTEIYNTVISGNRSYGIGYIYGLIENCTIVGNVYQGIVTTSSTSYRTVTITNSIIAYNGLYGINKVRSSTTVNLLYNNVFGNPSGPYTGGLTAGENDIHVDPLFADSGSWDADGYWIEGIYTLKSIAGRYSDETWVYDEQTSLCIDAGNPESVSSVEPAPNGGIINLGAYGGTTTASKSPFGAEPYCTKAIPGDVNDDCKLDLTDLAVICQHWLECNLEPQSACFPE